MKIKDIIDNMDGGEAIDWLMANYDKYDLVEKVVDPDTGDLISSTELPLLAAVKSEIDEGISLARQQRGSEHLAGNIVKEEYWKGESVAYERMQMVLLAGS